MDGREWWAPRRTRVLPGPALVAVLLVGGACTGPQPEPPPDGPRVELGFTQLLPEEGTRRGLLRVTSAERTPFTVTRVGLEWPGYGGAFGEPKDVEVPAGATRDLKLRLPRAVCPPAAPPGGNVPDTPVAASLDTSSGPVVQPLTRYGQAYVRRLWRRQCERAVVGRHLDLAWSRTWVVRGVGAAARASGALVLTRRAGEGPVELVDVQGSVLHGVRLGQERVLPEGSRQATLPLEVLPGDRCDEHARGQATAPFDFLLRLRVGKGPALTVALVPPTRVQAAATRALDKACRARAR